MEIAWKVPTAPETNSKSHLKMDDWKTFGTIFRGHVSFRECNICNHVQSYLIMFTWTESSLAIGFSHVKSLAMTIHQQ